MKRERKTYMRPIEFKAKKRKASKQAGKARRKSKEEQPMSKYTPEPWNESRITDVISRTDLKRAIQCVNACAGQRIDLVELATAHYDACLLWESEMMKAIGEDGVGSVAKAIAELKRERDEAVNALTPFGESIKLLRDLADLQNCAPLEQHRKEWEETMEQVYDFLNRWEGQ